MASGPRASGDGETLEGFLQLFPLPHPPTHSITTPDWASKVKTVQRVLYLWSVGDGKEMREIAGGEGSVEGCGVGEGSEGSLADRGARPSKSPRS